VSDCLICARYPALFVRRFRGLGHVPACVRCLLRGWARGHLILTPEPAPVEHCATEPVTASAG
jgi:hypothetical protein